VSLAARPAEARPRLREAFHRALVAAKARPSFALYLLALLLFPFKWLSPFSHRQAEWADVFVAAAFVTWSLEQLRAGIQPRLRAPHWFGLAYLGLGAASALLAPAGLSTGGEGVLIMLELAALAMLTSDYARSPERCEAIVLAILVVVFVTFAEVVVALALFYAGSGSSLVYGWVGASSSLYVRVEGGFYSAPLLSSFCVFASALVAREEPGIPARWRRVAQLALAIIVLFTFSRGIIAFALAFVLREAHRRGTRRARTGAVLASILAVLAIVALTAMRFYPSVSHPSRTVITTPFQVHGNDRLQPITTSFDTLVKHPILGLGPDSITGHFELEPLRPHFTPLDVAATMGLPALVALVGLVWALWRARRRPTDLAIWSGLAGLGLDALGQDAEHFRHIWIMLGLADADRAEEPPLAGAAVVNGEEQLAGAESGSGVPIPS
jgi:hypothetical protein